MRHAADRWGDAIPSSVFADLAEGVILARMGSTLVSRALGSIAWGAVRAALGGTVTRRLPVARQPRDKPKPKGVMITPTIEYFPAPKKDRAK